MSREAVNLIKDCGMEAGGRLAMLEGLAHYMNEETGVARVSLVSLTTVTRLQERQLRNLRRELLDPETGHGLVQLVEPVARGRRRGDNPSAGLGSYWLNLRRLAPVATAVREARRGIHAGAARALDRQKLIGLPGSYENAVKIIRALHDAVEAERAQAAYLEQPVRERELAARVGAIRGQMAVLQAVAEAEIGPGNAAMIAGFPGEESGNDCRINPGNSAIESVNSAISCNTPPHPPYKDYTPGISLHARTGAREAGCGIQGGEGLLQAAIETAGLAAGTVRWLEGVSAVVEGSVLVLHAPGRATAGRLRGELAADVSRIVRALNLETCRVEG